MQLPLRFNREQSRPWGSVPSIDWSHPLTQKMVFCGYDTGAGAIVDLMSGVVAVAGGLTNAPSLGTAYGSGRYFDNTTTVQQLLWNQGSLSSLAGFATASPYSIASVWWQNQLAAQGTSNFPTVFSVSDTGGGDAISFGFDDADTTKLSGGNDLAGLTSATGTISANKFYVAAFCQPISGSAVLYLNGANIASGAVTNYALGSTPILSWPGWTSQAVGGLAVGTRTGTVQFLTMLWSNRTLTQAETLSLYQDPYQFLIYPEDDIFSKLVGKAPAHFFKGVHLTSSWGV